MNDLRMLPNVLRRRREELGVTQREVARRAELSPMFISDIEAGRRLPSARAAKAIAEALQSEPLEFWDALRASKIASLQQKIAELQTA